MDGAGSWICGLAGNAGADGATQHTAASLPAAFSCTPVAMVPLSVMLCSWVPDCYGLCVHTIHCAVVVLAGNWPGLRAAVSATAVLLSSMPPG